MTMTTLKTLATPSAYGGMPRTTVPKSARALGWFSLGLGVAELMMPRRVARLTGLQGREGLLMLCGLREIATGVGLLASRRDPAPWLRARVAGDLIDMALIGSRLHGGNPHVSRSVLALGAVAGVAAADLAAVKVAGHHRRTPVVDYSDRSGFRRPLPEMRGAALKDFEAPRDFRVPAALRPRMNGQEPRTLASAR
jgi:hypothetical protein